MSKNTSSIPSEKGIDSFFEGEIVDQEQRRCLAYYEGMLDNNALTRKFNETLFYLTLYKIKESKAYLETHKSFEEYCKSIRECRRSLDNIFADLLPIYEGLDGNIFRCLNIRLNKIRYLGRSLVESHSGDIAFDGRTLVLELGGKIESYAWTPENQDAIEDAIIAFKNEVEERLKLKDTQIEAVDKKLKEAKREKNLYSEKLSKTEKEFDLYRLRTEKLDLEPAEIETIQDLNSLVNEFAALIFRISPDQDRLIELILGKKCEAVRLQYIGAIAGISNAVRMLVANVENHYGPIEKIDSEACRSCKAAREHCERRELGCCRTCEDSISCTSKQKCDMERVFEEHGRIYKEKIGITDVKHDENPPASPFNKGENQSNVHQLHKDRPIIQ
jgi:hypothetical protein